MASKLNTERKAGAQRRKRSPAERLQAIMPTFVWDAQKAIGKHPVALTSSGGLIDTLDAFVSICAEASGTTSRSLWRWRRLFLQGGGNIDALRDQPRSDKGSSHLFRGRALAIAVICGLHTQGRSVRSIYNTLAERWFDL